jgi:hypothetical protein
MGMSPTKLKLSMTLKILDIIVPTFLGVGDENCHKSGQLTSPKSV